MNLIGSLYFYVCAAVAIAGAIATVTARNPIRGAVSLLVMVVSIAGLFLALSAEFLAAIQLIVYAGAIVVLFLFVIMILGESSSSVHDKKRIVSRTLAAALLGAVSLGAIVLVVGVSTPLQAPRIRAGFGGIDAIGRALFSDWVVPFELSSALLMVAVLGAVAIAKGDIKRPLESAATTPGSASEEQP